MPAPDGRASAALAAEPLNRRLVLGGTGQHRRDDVAALRRLAGLHDDDVPVEDPRVDHRVAVDREREVLGVAGEPHRDHEVVLDVLFGEGGRPGSDPAEQRHDDPFRPRRVRKGHRPGLRRVLVQQPASLEVRELRVDARGGREAHRLPDLADGGGVAALPDGGPDEVQDPLLAGGELLVVGSVRCHVGAPS